VLWVSFARKQIPPRRHSPNQFLKSFLNDHNDSTISEGHSHFHRQSCCCRGRSYFSLDMRNLRRASRQKGMRALVRMCYMKAGLLCMAVFSLCGQVFVLSMAESFFFKSEQVVALNVADTIFGVNLASFVERINVTSSSDTQVILNKNRKCSSPERRKVSWPLVGTTPSFTSPLACGISGNTVLNKFFRELAASIKETHGKECRRMVRFGVAFGTKHVGLLKITKGPIGDIDSCSFMFVLEEAKPPPVKLSNNTNPRKSYRYSHNLVPIPRQVLPYKNMRRNTKLFKMHGHELFPWAWTIIWQDAKFKKQNEPESFLKFIKNLGSSCLTTMGLPVHPSAFGDRNLTGYTPQYQDHCDTVVNATRKRPTVTDSVGALLLQCHFYSNERRELGVSMDRGLIDTAFMVWNQDTAKCREYNARLACTWSDEIQCHSDRDQIAFPKALGHSGVRESASSEGKNASVNHLYLEDDSGDVMVKILRSNCHWYFGSLDKCIK